MLRVKNLSLKLGGLQILNQLSFEVKPGSITGLIGPNGAGKSTFFNALFNLFPLQSGSILYHDTELSGLTPDQVHRLGIARTFQDARLLPQVTVLENLLVSAPYVPDVTLRRVFFDAKRLDDEKRAHTTRAHELLKKVGLEDKAHTLAKNLSYGQTKLIEILKLFMSDNRLVLLDEPFSGLFPEMIKRITALIRELIDRGATLMLVEHNMKLIREVCDHVIVMDAGSKIAEGPFDEVKKDPVVIEAYLGH